MTPSFRLSILATLMVFAASTTSSEAAAFVSLPIIQSKIKTNARSQITPLTRVFSSEPFQEDKSVNLPSWLDLPRPAKEEVVSQELFMAEAVIGRIAMAGAMIILAKEVITGESISEQFFDVVRYLH